MDILLVEDELEFAGYPKRGLPHAGYRKSFAQNSEEGLENFDQSRPLFLILDVMLPTWRGAVRTVIRIQIDGDRPQRAS